MLVTTLLIITLGALNSLHAFNLETKVNVWNFFNNNPESNFGYTVSLTNLNNDKWLTVGAPGLTGAIYICELNGNNQCTLYNETTADPNHIDNQRLGFSMANSKESSMFCAPLWHKQIGSKWYQYVGRCSIVNKTETVHVTVPCENLGVNQGNYGFCEAGLGASSSTKEELYVLGAPGSKSFRGAVFVVQRSNSGYESFGSTTFTPDVNNQYTLLGYSVAWGNFTGSPRGDVVGGSPKMDNLKGTVYIFTISADSLTNPFILKPSTSEQQTGSYYGSSLCAVDLNNDGKDDLLVGAPFYSQVRNEGRVYVYRNKAVNPFAGFDTLDPLVGDSTVGGQFGATIVNLGDLNDDKFPDVAIGAPYGGSDGKGAVYIYNGQRNGIFTKYSQVIFASDIPNSGAGFGMAISQGLDVDGNNFPDIAIGSYSVGRVHLFRSRSVASLFDELKTNVTEISIKSNNLCRGPDGKTYQCVELEVTLQDKAERGHQNFSVEVTITLDEKKFPNNRAFIWDSSANGTASIFKENVTLTRGVPLLMSRTVYVKVSVDTTVESPIEITTLYRILPDAGSCLPALCPVLDVYGTTTSTTQLTYQIQCDGGVCHTDLSVGTPTLRDTLSNELIDNVKFGSDRAFSISSSVTNFNESAYQSMLKVIYSADFSVDTANVDGKTRVVSEKPLATDLTMKEVSFHLDNPISKDQIVSFSVSFSVVTLRPSSDVYNFTLTASSLGNDSNPSSNMNFVEATPKVETCVHVTGKVKYPLVFYNSALVIPQVNATIQDLGPEQELEFKISNKGKLDADTLLVNLELPLQREGLDVLYLVNLLANGIQCNTNVNQKNYLLPTTAFPATVLIQRKRRAVSNPGICGDGNCTTYACPITRISTGGYVVVKAVLRLYASNLGKLKTPLTTINSKVSVLFNGPQKHLNIQRTSGCDMQTSASFNVVAQETKEESSDVEWWWILLAIVGALILLAIVCAILYRVGFFKRNYRRREAEEASQAQMVPENGAEKKRKYDIEED